MAKPIILLFTFLLLACNEKEQAKAIASAEKSAVSIAEDNDNARDNDITADFKDARFLVAVWKLRGKEIGEPIYDTDVANVTHLNLYDMKIANLAGIEHFKNLEYLFVKKNRLSTLDVSKNTSLKSLSVENNLLTSLDVSKNVALYSLGIENNHIVSLDLSKNVALKYLGTENNKMTSLDVSKNVALDELIIENNNLTSLDLSKNEVLHTLNCSENLMPSKAAVKCFKDKCGDEFKFYPQRILLN